MNETKNQFASIRVGLSPSRNKPLARSLIMQDIDILAIEVARANTHLHFFQKLREGHHTLIGLRVLEWVNCGVFRAPKRAKTSRGAGFVLHSTRPPAVEGSLDLQCLEFAI